MTDTHTAATAEATHHVAHAAEHHHAPHELPNFLTLLSGKYEDNAVLQFLHQWENLFFSGAILAFICFIFIKAAHGYSLIPQGSRNFMEALVEGIENFVVGVMGENGRKHVPFLGTIFLYILIMNYCGMVPLLKAPSSAWSTTIALATISVFYIHIAGLRALGIKTYLHHIAGSPSNVIAWVIGIVLIFPLNLVLEYMAVPLSLSLRLFANISSEDRMLLNFATLNTTAFFPSFGASFLLQLFANMMAVLFSTVQAFVFTLLTAVYIYTMSPHGDDHGSGHHTSEPLAQPGH
ncbi:MAG TPA: FoF1 ATP synthase subunit a [Candidatus Omnitrophota bacterium]|nr:FoF1 ATP synthase subunit a [Candidatus Omnitrophota bacterium]